MIAQRSLASTVPTLVRRRRSHAIRSMEGGRGRNEKEAEQRVCNRRAMNNARRRSARASEANKGTHPGKKRKNGRVVLGASND